MTRNDAQPTGQIVQTWYFEDINKRFQLEKLLTPYRQGAGVRLYRLWEDGRPAWGGQWAYDVEHAEERVRYVAASYRGAAIRHLEQRVADLDKQVRELKWASYLVDRVLR